MVRYTSAETLDEMFWYEGIESFFFNYGLVWDRGLCTFLFSVIKELPEGRDDLTIYILLFGNKRNYWKMFYGGFWYSTMNATLTIKISPFQTHYRKEILWSYIITILLAFIIRFRLIMWSLLSSTIIIAGTWCFTRSPHLFWIISLERCDWSFLNIHKKRICCCCEKWIKCVIYLLFFILVIYLWK